MEELCKHAEDRQQGTRSKTIIKSTRRSTLQKDVNMGALLQICLLLCPYGVKKKKTAGENLVIGEPVKKTMAHKTPILSLSPLIYMLLSFYLSLHAQLIRNVSFFNNKDEPKDYGKLILLILLVLSEIFTKKKSEIKFCIHEC